MIDAVPDGPRNVLLVGPDGPAEEVSVDLVSERSPEETHLLNVTFDREPDELAGEYRARHGVLPAKTGVIEVGGQTRSAAASAPTGPGPTPLTVDSVGDPSDLTGLSMAISAYLDAWEGEDETPVVCLNSLSAWLSQVDEKRVYEFIHVLVGKLRAIGADAYFSVNPDVHDDATINRFAAHMDAVVHVGPDGDSTVRTRR